MSVLVCVAVFGVPPLVLTIALQSGRGRSLASCKQHV